MNGSFELRAQSARIKAWLPRLREQRDEAEERYHQLEQLLQDEKAALTELLDAADVLDGNGSKPAPPAKPAKPKPPPVPEGMKRCPTCGETKNRNTGYYRNRTAHDGVQNACKDCDRARTTEARERRKAEAAKAPVAS